MWGRGEARVLSDAQGCGWACTVLGTHCPPCWQVLIPPSIPGPWGPSFLQQGKVHPWRAGVWRWGRVPGGGQRGHGANVLGKNEPGGQRPLLLLSPLEMGGVLALSFPDPPPGMLVTPLLPPNPTYTHPWERCGAGELWSLFSFPRREGIMVRFRLATLGGGLSGRQGFLGSNLGSVELVPDLLLR